MCAWPLITWAAYATPSLSKSKVRNERWSCLYRYTSTCVSVLAHHSNHTPCVPSAAPYWLDKPTNLVLAPDENGRLVCRANGNPKPNIQWLINGQPIESMGNSYLSKCLSSFFHHLIMISTHTRTHTH